jgi:hypothetical protein
MGAGGFGTELAVVVLLKMSGGPWPAVDWQAAGGVALADHASGISMDALT